VFKKIEIWILYLVLILVIISYIFFGAMVLREIKSDSKPIPIITPLSKAALFLSEIPKNIMKMTSLNSKYPHRNKKNENLNFSGFNGHGNEKDNYLLLSRYDGNEYKSVIELVNLKSFKILHTWKPEIENYLEKVDNIKDEKWEKFLELSEKKRLKIYHPLLQDNGSLIFQTYFSPLFKINKDSELEWVKSDVAYHHSTEEDSDGNIWICVGYYPYKIDKRYVGDEFGKYRDDGIRKLSPKGEILFDKSVSELLIENKMEYLLFGLGGWERDPIHLNDIEPVNFDGKYWKKGDLFLSLRNQSMIILYRPSTNEIIWKGAGEFFNQHDVDVLDDTRISIFDNNFKYTKNKRRGKVDRYNRIVIYDFENNQYSYHIDKSLKKEKVKSTRGGRSEILNNGNVLIEETHGGRLLYFNKDGSLRWSYLNRANNDFVYNLGWSRILYKDKDISQVRSFLNQGASE